MTYPRRKGCDLIGYVGWAGRPGHAVSARTIAGSAWILDRHAPGLARLERVRIVVDAVPIAGALRTGLDTLSTLTPKVRFA